MSSPTRFTYSESFGEFTAAQRLTSAQLPSEKLRTLLEVMGGSPLQALAESSKSLRKAAPLSLTERQAERLLTAATAPLPKDFEKTVQTLNIRILTWQDPEYPQILLPFADAPALLFIRGQIPEEMNLSLAIVGSRRATLYGRGQTERFTRAFVESGGVIVSGGAAGIDTVAHKTALDSGASTIAVLGCGVDHAYPIENRGLFTRIAEGNGAVISEYPIGATPEPWHFPARNRIIAGLSHATVVIESPSDSGALITARCAAEYGRPVFAVPGGVDTGRSRGCHDLIRDGAFIADSPEDVLLSFGLTQEQKTVKPQTRMRQRTQDIDTTASMDATIVTPAPMIPAHSLSQEEEQVLANLSTEPKHVDEICQLSGLTAAQVGVATTLLEMKSLIRRMPGNLFIRTT